MFAGRRSAAGCCAGTACLAGACATEPVTSPPGTAATGPGMLNAGARRDGAACWGAGWIPTGGAGVRLGSDCGDSRLAVMSAERGAAGVAAGEVGSSFGMAATLAASPSSASVPTASASIFAASLLSIVSKMPKSKMLPRSWNEPAMIATILAASSADLTRVATLLRMGGATSSEALRTSAREMRRLAPGPRPGPPGEPPQ